MSINSIQTLDLQQRLQVNQQQEIKIYIENLQPIVFNQHNYNNLLNKWIQYDEDRRQKYYKMKNIVQAKKKDSKNAKTNSTCLVCYEQISSKKQWCRMCGMECCLKCIGRYRVFPIQQNHHPTQYNQNPALPCCQKCDKIYMDALCFIQSQRQIQFRRKAFQKVQLYSNNQPKIKQKLNFNIKKINSLNATKSSIQLQNLELHKKITWGQDVKKKLESQYRKIRRKLSKSVSSSVNESSEAQIDPPIAYESETSKSQIQKLNQSIIQDETQLVIDKGRCCVACRLM